MRKPLLLINLLLALPNLLYAQFYTDFDHEIDENIIIDTITNKNNIWEIGIPNKPNFENAYSAPNAICTDLNDSYPTNDTSSFNLIYEVGLGFVLGGEASLNFKYMIDADSLGDFGTIEFSPDNGNSWLNLLTDSMYQNLNINWYPSKPTFTGKSHEWKDCQVSFLEWHQETPFDWGDKVQIKFTFISDSINTDRSGWIIDNLLIDDWYDSIENYRKQISGLTVYPNPTRNYFQIDLKNKNHKEYTISLYNSRGDIISSFTTISESVKINLSNSKPGIYFYRINSTEKIAFGQIIKE